MSVMTYKELISQESKDYHSKLYLVMRWDKEDEKWNYKINSLLIREGRVYSWGNYVGDDPDVVPKAGDGESANCVKQEDFFDELFLEIPEENALFEVINGFLERSDE